MDFLPLALAFTSGFVAGYIMLRQSLAVSYGTQPLLDKRSSMQRVGSIDKSPTQHTSIKVMDQQV